MPNPKRKHSKEELFKNLIADVYNNVTIIKFFIDRIMTSEVGQNWDIHFGPGPITIDPLKIKIEINGYILFEKGKADVTKLKEVSESIRDLKRTDINVNLGEGLGSWTSWGCDLSYEYVKTNAEYTTQAQ